MSTAHWQARRLPIPAAWPVAHARQPTRGRFFRRPGADPADRSVPHCRDPSASLLQPGAHDHQRDGRTGRNRPVGHDRRHLPGRRLLPRHRRGPDRCPGVRPCAADRGGPRRRRHRRIPEPAGGSTPRHLAWTVLGAVTIAVWPAFAARRASPRPLILSVYGSAAVTAVFMALLGWLLAETRDGSVLGLAERLTSSIQTCWPFIIAVALRRTQHPRPGLATGGNGTVPDGNTRGPGPAAASRTGDRSPPGGTASGSPAGDRHGSGTPGRPGPSCPR